MERIGRLLAWAIDVLAGLLPAEKREWADAVRAEACQLPSGWPRLDWLAGGLWLVVKEAQMVRKVGYWLGIGVVAAVLAWAAWKSWYGVPASDAEAGTDRIRLVVGAAALVGLPWVGRRHGWFGPVAGSLAARVLRVAGLAAVCAIGVALVISDGRAGRHGLGDGSVNWLREIAGLVVLAALVGIPLLIMAIRPSVEASTLWGLTGVASTLVWVLLPVQMLAIAAIAVILLGTSRRFAIGTVPLVSGAITGVAAGLVIYGCTGLADAMGLWFIFLLLVFPIVIAVPAGAISGWMVQGEGAPEKLREARIRQGLLAGTVAGVCCGLVLGDLTLVLAAMLLIGPVAGLVGGALGGGIAAQHPLPSGPDGWRSAGLFVSSRS
jgi:hypothetical protein